MLSKLNHAIVTGASPRIRAAFAERFARRYYDVVVIARNDERLGELKASLDKTGRSIELLVLGLSDPAGLKRTEDCLSADDSVTMVINNAGPVQFGTRLLAAAMSGAAVGYAVGSPLLRAVAGVVGAVIGTLGGAAARGRLAAAIRRDLPAAHVEDATAIPGALLIVSAAT